MGRGEKKVRRCWGEGNWKLFPSFSALLQFFLFPFCFYSSPVFSTFPCKGASAEEGVSFSVIMAPFPSTVAVKRCCYWHTESVLFSPDRFLSRSKTFSLSKRREDLLMKTKQRKNLKFVLIWFLHHSFSVGLFSHLNGSYTIYMSEIKVTAISVSRMFLYSRSKPVS